MLGALSGQTPPPSLARVIHHETEGNPFFVAEVFQHLAEEGQLFDTDGRWRADLRIDSLEVPEGVRLVIGRRLERLGEAARRVLTTAAVVGRTFSLRLLEALEEGASPTSSSRRSRRPSVPTSWSHRPKRGRHATASPTS